MLKAGAVAGAALILPAGRIPMAWALTSDPCFKPCTTAAAKAFASTRNGTCKLMAAPFFAGLLALGTPESTILLFRGANDFNNCLGNAELDWHRAVEACRGSECGNPATYPGGQAPRKPQPKCPGAVPCGNDCCDIVAQCCPCSTVESGYICCASNANCDCCPKS